MADDQETWTINDDTRASHPGGIRASRLRWLWHYPTWPLIWAGTLMIAVALAWFLHWGFWILAGLLLIMNLLYWVRVREHFLQGCANPAIVVSLDPMLIAVFTDLSMGVGSYPAIKIVEKKLKRIAGQEPTVGTRVATVALYSASLIDDKANWDDFDPRPVDCVTGNLADINRLLKGFSDKDWHDLQEGLKQVPKPFRSGLYRLWTSSKSD